MFVKKNVYKNTTEKTIVKNSANGTASHTPVSCIKNGSISKKAHLRPPELKASTIPCKKEDSRQCRYQIADSGSERRTSDPHMQRNHKKIIQQNISHPCTHRQRHSDSGPPGRDEQILKEHL